MTYHMPERRTILIKKDFQIRLMLAAFGLIVFSGFCSAILIYVITGEDLQSQALSAHATIASTSQRLILSILIGNIVSIFVAGIISVISILYTSHKLAGPLYRFESLCEQIANGNLDGVTKLRQNDQLQDLAQAFAHMVENLRQQSAARTHLLERMRVQVNNLHFSQNLTSDQQQSLTELRLILEQFEQTKKT